MKIYKLDVDAAQPTNQVVQMQQGATGLLSATITNNGKYIRNLSCTLYDGDNEISAVNGGFKVDVGAESKQVKIVAKSEPIESVYSYFLSKQTAGPRAFVLSCFQLQEGVYNQDEFYEVVRKFGHKSGVVEWLFPQNASLVNFDRIALTPWNPEQQIWFYKTIDGEYKQLGKNEPIIATGFVSVQRQVTAGRMSTLSSDTYPAIGYYTDYKMDTLIRPSTNAPYDGEYIEPLKEVEVDGVKFVPTTLSVDGVEYKVLAEAQPTPEPEPEEPTEPETTEGE